MESSELIEKVHKLESNEAVIIEKIEVSNHRIDDLEQEIKSNRELIIAVKEIANEMKHMKEDQANMNKRLESIEEKPLKDYEETKRQIKNKIIAFVLGIALTSIAFALGLSKFL